MGLQEKMPAWVQLILMLSIQPLVKNSNRAKWKDMDRYDVGMYSSEYGPAAAVRQFKRKFPKLNESTEHYFKKRYEDSLNERNENETTPSKALTKYKTKTGRPLLLGELDAMVQKYLRAASNQGAVISRTSAISAAKALLQKYPNMHLLFFL